MTSLLHKERRSLIFLGGEKLGSIIITMLASFVVIRELGPENYGRYSALINMIAITASLSQLGLGPVLVREIVRRPDKEGELLGGALLARFSLAVVVYVVLVNIFFMWHAGGMTASWELEAGLLLATLILAQPYPLTMRSAFEARVLSPPYSRATLKNLCIGAAMRIGTALSGLGALYIAFAQALEFFFGNWFVRRASKKNLESLKWSYCWSNAYEITKQGVPFMIAALLTGLALKTDVLMLRWLKGGYEAGVYGAASRMTEIYQIFPGILIGTFLPRLVAQKKQSEREKISLQLFRAVVFVAILVMVLNWVVVGPILPMILGRSFQESVIILQLHSFCGIPLFLVALRDQMMMADGLGALRILFALTGLGVNLLANSILIPPFGALGAAWATLISLVFAVLFFPLFFKKTRFLAWLQLSAIIFPNPLPLLRELKSKREKLSINTKK